MPDDNEETNPLDNLENIQTQTIITCSLEPDKNQSDSEKENK